MNDISDLVDVDAIATCPICSNGIGASEEATICKAHGFAVLVHELCLVLEDEEDDE